MLNKTSKYLVWMDLEMTGLEPEKDTILEIATIITDKNLDVIAKGPNLIIHHKEDILNSMDSWNTDHHKKSGLWNEVLNSTVSLKEAEHKTLEFIKQYIPKRQSPLCGNSIWQDRRFLAKHMNELEGYLHYRIIDVSSIKELTKYWYSDIGEYDQKTGGHRALDDIMESIEELKFYRDHIFK